MNWSAYQRIIGIAGSLLATTLIGGCSYYEPLRKVDSAYDYHSKLKNQDHSLFKGVDSIYVRFDFGKDEPIEMPLALSNQACDHFAQSPVLAELEKEKLIPNRPHCVTSLAEAKGRTLHAILIEELNTVELDHLYYRIVDPEANQVQFDHDFVKLGSFSEYVEVVSGDLINRVILANKPPVESSQYQAWLSLSKSRELEDD